MLLFCYTNLSQVRNTSAHIAAAAADDGGGANCDDNDYDDKRFLLVETSAWISIFSRYFFQINFTYTHSYLLVFEHTLHKSYFTLHLSYLYDIFIIVNVMR